MNEKWRGPVFRSAVGIRRERPCEISVFARHGIYLNIDEQSRRGFSHLAFFNSSFSLSGERKVESPSQHPRTAPVFTRPSFLSACFSWSDISRRGKKPSVVHMHILRPCLGCKTSSLFNPPRPRFNLWAVCSVIDFIRQGWRGGKRHLVRLLMSVPTTDYRHEFVSKMFWVGTRQYLYSNSITRFVT